jgi:hypothetical protein
MDDIIKHECPAQGTFTCSKPRNATFFGIDMATIPFTIQPNFRTTGGGTIGSYTRQVWQAVGVFILDRDVALSRCEGRQITLCVVCENRKGVSLAKAAVHALRKANYDGMPRCLFRNDTDELYFLTGGPSKKAKTKILDTSDRPTLDAVIQQLVLRLVANPLVLGQNIPVDFLEVHNFLYNNKFGSHFFCIEYRSVDGVVQPLVNYLEDKFIEVDCHGEGELKLCNVVLKYAEDKSPCAHKRPFCYLALILMSPWRCSTTANVLAH